MFAPASSRWADPRARLPSDPAGQPAHGEVRHSLDPIFPNRKLVDLDAAC